MAKLTEEFGKERNLLVVCSVLIFLTVIFGLTYEGPIPYLNIKLSSEESALFVSVLSVLNAYFMVRLIIEWNKSEPLARKKAPSKIDFWLSLLIGMAGETISIYELTANSSFWELPIIPSAIILILGEYIAETTAFYLIILFFIRSKEYALTLGLPRLPISLRRFFYLIPVNIFLIGCCYFSIQFVEDEVLSEFWYWILITPIAINISVVSVRHVFLSKDKKSELQRIVDKHDVTYLTHGWAPIQEVQYSDLYKATSERDAQEVEKLLKLGKDPNEKNQSGWSPFLLSVANGDKSIIDLFLEYGADVNDKNSLDRTGLHFCCNYGYYEIAEKLIELGANVNYEDTGENGVPICMAAIRGHKDIVELLLDSGANPEMKDRRGKNTLEYAKEKEFGEIVKTLRVARNRKNKGSVA